MLAVLKVTFLFIGTSIGAGFSSGREIALFFGGLSPYCVALSAVFIAVLCILFLIAGKIGAVPSNPFVRFGIFLSASISLCSMLAGGEYILRSLSGIPMLGLIMAIVGAVIVIFGIEKIKWANTLLIPTLVIILIVLYIKDGAPVYDGGFSILKPIHYSGLDVLLSGVMLSREGKKLSYKQIVLSGAAVCLFLFFMLFMLQNIVLSDELHSSMPVLAVAEKVGLKFACGILIGIAIFTTLIGALEISVGYAQQYLSKSKKLGFIGKPENKPLAIFGALTIAYPISFLGFENIVDFCYPFISACGILLVVCMVFKLTYMKIQEVRGGRKPLPATLSK